MSLLAGDACLERGLGYRPPKATAVREFLELFHEKDLEKLRPSREEQKSFIFPAQRADPGPDGGPGRGGGAYQPTL